MALTEIHRRTASLPIHWLPWICLLSSALISHIDGACNCGIDCTTTCPAGTYWNASSAICLTCSPGYYCPGGSSGMVPCATGTSNPSSGQSAASSCVVCAQGSYASSSGSAQCTACPAGYKCSQGTINPSICSTGQYSPSGQPQCTPCPRGSMCPNSGMGAPTPCLLGAYASSTGQSACTNCPAGKQCSDPTSDPIACAGGYVAPATSTNCTRCPDNQVPNTGQISCASCAAGYSCTNSAVAPVACSVGTYANLGDAVCTPCPAGSMCPSTTSAPTPCSSGQYSTNQSTACTTCPAGYQCPTTSSVPQQCQPGQYAAQGSTSCTNCIKGNYCPTGAATPTICADGYYQDKDQQTTCVACPIGSQCPDKTALPQACPANTLSTGQLLACTACPANSVCQNGTTVVTCLSGYYANAATQTCTPCPAGSYCPSPSSSPQLCAAGTYSAGQQSACTQCPAGFACPNTNNPATITPCSSGTYAALGSGTCTPCPAGSACPTTSDSLVQACPLGTYSLGSQTNCTVCPEGQKCLTQSVSPVLCSSGTTSASGSTTCTPCPAGFACPTTLNSARVPCLPGTYSLGSATACTSCSPGNACPYQNQAVIVACAAGTYSTGGQVTCTSCPAGFACPSTTQNTTNPCAPGTYSSAGAVTCSNCAPGFYCSSPTGSPLPCSTGTYSMAAQTNCTTCEAGYYCPTTDGTRKSQCPPGTYSTVGSSSCVPCNPGYICVMGSVAASPPAGLCNAGGYCDGKLFYPCPAGTYNPNTGGTDGSSCVPCPAGYYCVGPGFTNYTTFPCPAGYFCPTGSKSANQDPCPGGTYNPNTTMPNQGACQLCPPGYFCSQASTTSGIICPAGFFCTVGQPSGYQNACPLGTWSNVTGLVNGSQCFQCPAGNYCPAGSLSKPTASPTPCPPGTYNPNTGSGYLLNCQSCDTGMACPSPGLTAPSQPCSVGCYCPNGTITNNQFPCPTGTYTDSTNLAAASQCSPCPAGKYCGWGTGGTVNVPQPCMQGYYCPQQTPAPNRYPCPAGTYSNLNNLIQASDCTTCPAGSYCLGAQTAPTGSCPLGYYCPLGTQFAAQFGCPNGTYNNVAGLSSSAQCLPCPSGSFCGFASLTPVQCPAGTYMPFGYYTSNSSIAGTPGQRQSDCLPCPGGFTCGVGTVTPQGCGLGKYSVPGTNQCFTCPMGYYCDSPSLSIDVMNATKRCPAGSFCLPGLSASSQASLCQVGSYCPMGTLEQLLCPVGTFRATTGAAAITDCAPCTPGFYCLSGRSTENGQCQAGYYCPTNIPNPFASIPSLVGSYGPQQVPCPAGTYASGPGTPNLSSCVNCTAGSYCQSATVNPTACPRGYYCPIGSSVPAPCPIGTYGNTGNLKALTDCTQCDPGSYCDSLGLSQPRGPCDPGFLCWGGAKTSSPRDNVTGVVCPAGGFCQAGSYNATPCPMGTYSNVTGAVNNQDCRNCPAGFYCSLVAGGAPTGQCWGGYFCTGSAYSPMQNVTPPGYYSTNGSSMPVACALGTYNGVPAQNVCTICPPGNFCGQQNMTAPVVCGPGTYCPAGSTYYQLCDVGTFSNSSGMSSQSNCSSCTPGSYCSDRGMTKVSGTCTDGFVCFGGALYPNPVFNNNTASNQTLVLWGDVCRPGYYCPAGGSTMLPCPVSTYNPNPAMYNLTAHCLPCTGGMFCNQTGLSAPTGSCVAGYYCSSAATVSTPPGDATGGICPLYNYCPAGSKQPIPCTAGYYGNATGLTQCALCPAGFICQAGVAPIPCQTGYYCPASQVGNLVLVAFPCPVGTINPIQYGKSVNDCIPCPSGQYCATQGLTNVTGLMDAGSWSLSGAQQSAYTQTTAKANYYGPCPLGYYCLQGSSTPQPCPTGTYGSSWGLRALTDCTQCPVAYACPNLNGTQCDTLNQIGCSKCAEGYYCLGGSPTTIPVNSTYGDVCPVGFYCTGGVKLICPTGTYQNVTQQNVCPVCPAGFYCNAGTSVPNKCPMGFYCLQGANNATIVPCPPGTYNGLNGGSTASFCLKCPPGRYCPTASLISPAGPCQPGFYCLAGASNSSFNSPDATGGPCTPGYICPSGSSTPVPCPGGLYCPSSQMDNATALCQAGYYCTQKATVPTPTDNITGNACPMGYYCPQGSASGLACPSGTYRNYTGGQSLASCFPCPGGVYCAGQANINPTGTCVAGYYCVANATQANPVSQLCPAAYMCPAGVIAPLPCPSGTYQDQMGNDTCKNCPDGYFCNATSTPLANYNGTACPMGNVCPTGAVSLIPCPLGTFNNLTGMYSLSTQCLPCPGGSVCDQLGIAIVSKKCTPGYFCRRGAASAAPNQTNDAGLCPIGFYCPLGTIEPVGCPAGTFSNTSGLSDVSQCLNCTAGYYCNTINQTAVTGLCSAGYFCPSGSSQFAQVACPSGSYCPTGSIAPTLCPNGTLNNVTLLSSASQCQPCPGGSYCGQPGLTMPSGPCQAGYYCPQGSTQLMPPLTVCPIGFYCPTGSALPIPCANNTYANQTMSSVCSPCPAGSYCPQSGVLLLCTQGYYCPAGTGTNLLACPSGTYGSRSGLYDVTQCTTCPAGMYCGTTGLSTPTGNCAAGYWCAMGVDMQYPGPANQSTTDTNTTYHNQCLKGWGGPCPPGYYCPSGSAFPIPCPGGTYANSSGQSVCNPCPSGYFCPNGSADYNPNPCPPGYYCPQSTTSGSQYPCPTGTYNSATKLQNSASCVPCPGSWYCSGVGQTNVTGLCAGGYYCSNGSFTPTPFGSGGNNCKAGYSCPQGSSSMQPCLPGQYCPTDYLNATSGNCSAGYYCVALATTMTPTDNIMGNVCPTGTYCPSGSGIPSLCPTGTYLNRTGGMQMNDCLPCIPGKFCSGTGNVNPVGLCNQGFYCPGGQQTDSPVNYTCPMGYYCPYGSNQPVPCPNGTYQDMGGQWTCKPCPAGYYCDNTNPNNRTTDLSTRLCPQGYYCPANTSWATQFPCPPGTFNNHTLLTNAAACQTCLPGQYCMLSGLVLPQGNCSAGYFCVSGALGPTPIQGSNANVCPQGFYCPAGTVAPSSCPPGSFGNQTQLGDVSQCTNCTYGYYCPSYNMTSVGPPCQAGFYCPLSANIANFAACPAGQYCPTGSGSPTPCPPGTYSNTTQLTAASSCTNCPAGWYCQQSGLTAPQNLCQQGYYCPTKSAVPNPIICPVGMFCPTGSDQPQTCSPGNYTNTTGAVVCLICPAGFYCLPVYLNNSGAPGIAACPAGYYCPAGVGSNWQSCPAGTYNAQTGLSLITQCKDCDGGNYCGTAGATSVTGPCWAGYYCTFGMDRPNPDSRNVNATLKLACPIVGGQAGFGDICPTGSFCLQGVAQPTACPAGTYQNQTGQSSCKGCPAGYYCVVNSTTYTGQSCPAGYYCPANTTTATANPCPPGTFNNQTGQSSITACLPCTMGSACEMYGLTAPNRLCAPGWYCVVGASNATPSTAGQGGLCPPGTYCPPGSGAPTGCTPGSYCQNYGQLNTSGLCQAGYYCPANATKSNPTLLATEGGAACPNGSYCPPGSANYTYCPAGTISTTLGAADLTTCLPCPLGKYCSQAGLASATGDCAPGYFCPGAQTTATPTNYSCPAGYYCVGGGGAAVPCPAGFYQDQAGQAQCKICPAGYFCNPNVTGGPVTFYGANICPSGYYCPNGTDNGQRYPCPLGTYNNQTGLSSSSQCTPCEAGWACDATGLTVPLRFCWAGYFCQKGALSQTPAGQSAFANTCPAGYYCPNGTAQPVACPAGTYSSTTGLQSATQCINCTAGSYCDRTGLTTVVGLCTAGYYCPSGSSNSTQTICPTGTYCPTGSYTPQQCPSGTFANFTGLVAVSGCTQCTPGLYCNSPGLSQPVGPCTAGYYCPLGSDSPTKVICPIGTYCLAGAPIYTICPDGQMAGATQMSSCLICPSGSYCVSSRVVVGNLATVQWPCPAGFYCSNGTGYNWQACPAGTFSSATSLAQINQCQACTGGFYCPLPNMTAATNTCSPGYYCTSGSTTSNPTGTGTCVADQNVVANICPVGSYCPGQTVTPVACPAGQYQNQTGQSNCKACPSGYYCPSNTSIVDNSLACPAGYFCPLGTSISNANPCPPGTYNNQTLQSSLSMCTSCTAGSYCDVYGMSSPRGPCQAGYYCPTGSTTATAIICPIGNFCPQGSSQPQNCTAGMYCSRTGLSAPEGNCNPGYYCPLAATSKQFIICPAGSYCQNGSTYPQSCPNGTFGPITQLQVVTDCSSCTAGYYCNGTGLTAVSGACSPGYYCPSGQTRPDPPNLICPAGYYCVGGRGAPDICPSGQFQVLTGRTTCDPCLAGFYCDNTLGPISNLSSYSCPSGYYCPSSTPRAIQYPCPIGTFNNVTGLTLSSQCTSCTPGYACTTIGLAYPNSLCSAGYYCPGGNTVANPPSTICPVGNYCPQGSFAPIPCPDGSMGQGTGYTSLSNCQPCPPGNYCTANMSSQGVSQFCNAGYVCRNSSSSPTPTDGTRGYMCPIGNYCPVGAVQPLPCQTGTYAPVTTLGACLLCPAGTTCPTTSMTSTNPCPSGFYCTNGTTDSGRPCPSGTFNPNTGAKVISDCLTCTPGSYCLVSGLSAPTGTCNPGYFCAGGAKVPAPNDGTNVPCPPGNYCPGGTNQTYSCPPGTFRAQTGGQSLADCYACTPGMYCTGTGLTAPTGVCDARYYCPDAGLANSSKPSSFLCPTGFYCPANTGIPRSCLPGFYQPSTGMDTCSQPCPAGYYCLGNTSNPIICPPYSYCPTGSINPVSCPNGTYTASNTTGLSIASQCANCPAGSYCTGGITSGPCVAGIWCKQGASEASPTVVNSAIWVICPVGFYCPNGTVDPMTCPIGTVITISGAYSVGQCGSCPAGYFCPNGSNTPELCSPGYYCEANSKKFPCPLYTYNSFNGATNVSWCLPCPAGYFCSSTGVANVSTVPCPPGFYCTSATNSPTACPAGTYRDTNGGASIGDCLLCPAGYYCPFYNQTGVPSVSGIQCSNGYYCPAGSQNQTQCTAGYYCNGSRTQIPCPPGYYCPAMSTAPLPCPVGHYCGVFTCSCTNGTLPGAIQPTKCPLGYKMYDGSPRSTFNNTCQPCPAGYYGNDVNRSVCQICRAGVVCLAIATTDSPLDNSSYWFGVNGTNAYPCPPGYYCPAGSGAPTPCPAGRYGPSSWGTSLDQGCPMCGINYFQNGMAQSACMSCGAAAYQNVLGSTTCNCTGGGRNFQISDRTCPCIAGYQLVSVSGVDTGECAQNVYPQCASGTYRNSSGSCLSATEWATYCKLQYCAVFPAYIGVDTSVPMCLCQVDDLQTICDKPCQVAQRNIITYHCPTAPLEPFIRVTSSAGVILTEIPTYNLRGMINWENSFGSSRCTDRSINTSFPIYMLEVSSSGFLGVYQPDPTQLINMLTGIAKGTYTGNVTLQGSGSTGGLGNRRRLLTTSSVSGSSFSGVFNPVSCLQYGDTMVWSVSQTNYPVYDVNNLLNSNTDFDYGGFRALATALTQSASTMTLFSFTFTSPGTYVFMLSSNSNSKMYIVVMQRNTVCPVQGPFLPQTATNFIMTGLQLQSGILRQPDWKMIGVFIACLIIALLVLLAIILLFRRYGWTKNTWIQPIYRYFTSKQNFDEYASRGSTVQPYKKSHPNVDAARDLVVAGAVVGSTSGRDELLPNSEFWDYEKQIDLEGFAAKRVYDILERQALRTTKEIGKQKDQMKDIFQRLATQADSLKSLWLAKLQQTDPFEAQETGAYEVKLREFEAELRRRKEIGSMFSTSLLHQMDLLRVEEDTRRSHEVRFRSTAREAIRQLVEPQEGMNAGQAAQKARFLVENLDQQTNEECLRTGQSQALGALLLNTTKSTEVTPFALSDLVSRNGANVAEAVRQVTRDEEALGVRVPKPGARMLAPDGETHVEVPDNWFLHPGTGLLLPQSYNLVYDSRRNQFDIAVNSVGLTPSKSAPDQVDPAAATALLLPFIAHPRAGGPVKLKPLHKGSTLALGQPMHCPKTGLPCPILGVTLHPETRQVLPVGGTHIDPITGLPVAIEIGGLMLDPNTKMSVPIVGVCIDPDSGCVVPVGQEKLEFYSQFIDPSTKKNALLTSASADTNQMLPSNGGTPGLLYSQVLNAEIEVKAALEGAIKRLESGDRPSTALLSGKLDASLKNLEEARERLKLDFLCLLQNMEKEFQLSGQLASSGGSPGYFEYKKTGRLFPLLYGSLMEDPGGSDYEVPILGCMQLESGALRPLGGTLEAPDGSGLVPIVVGSPAVDPATGSRSTIVGVAFDSTTEMTIPLTVASSPWRTRQPDPALASRMEEEILARQSYWRRVRVLADDLTRHQFTLSSSLIYSDNVPSKEVVARSLADVESMLTDLDHLRRTEVQRRTEFRSALPEQTSRAFCPSLALLLDNDDSEAESGDKLATAHAKYITNVERLHKRVSDAGPVTVDVDDEEDSQPNPSANRQSSRSKMELTQGVLTLMESLDRQHSELVYWQKRDDLLLNSALAFFQGKLSFSGDYYNNLFLLGSLTVPEKKDDELINLLKQLIALLNNGGPFYLTTDILNLIQGTSPASSAKSTTVVYGGASGPDLPQRAGQQLVQGASATSTRAAGHLQMNAAIPTSTTSESGDLSRDLYAKQALRVAQLEASLRASEIKEIQAVIEAYDKEKDQSLAAVRQEARVQLSKCTTDADRERVILANIKNMEARTEAAEREKQEQLAALRKRINDIRRQKKKQLKRELMEEMQANGFQPDMAPEVRLLTENEINADLVRLQNEQDALLSDLRRSQVEAAADVMGFEAYLQQLKETGLVLTPNEEAELKQLLGKSQLELNSLKDKLNARSRKSRKSKDQLLAEANLTGAERETFLQSQNGLEVNDTSIENDLLLDTLRAVSEEKALRFGRTITADRLSDVDSLQRDQILRDCDENLERLSAKAAQQRKVQKDDIIARMAATKKITETNGIAASVEQCLADMADADSKRLGGKNGEALEEIRRRMAAELDAKRQQLSGQHRAELESLELKYLKMLHSIDRGNEDEFKTQLETVNEEDATKKQLVIGQLKQDFDSTVAGKNLTNEQMRQLMSKFEQDKSNLIANLELQRQRHKDALKERLRNKKQQAIEAAAAQHEEDNTKLLLDQKTQRDQVLGAASRKIEIDVLSPLTKNASKDEAENLIYHALLQRHLREAVDLEAKLADQLASSVNAQVSEVKRKREAQRADLIAAHITQLAELDKNPDRLSPDELAAQRKQLLQTQNRSLAELDDLTNTLLDRVAKEAARAEEIKACQMRLDLRERQLRELVEAISKLSPDEELRQKYQKQLAQFQADLEKYRAELASKMAEEGKTARDILEREEQEKRRRLAEEMAALQQRYAQEIADEEDKLRRRQEAKDQALKTKLAERQARERAEAQAAGLNAADLDRLMHEHNSQVAELNASQRAERERATAQLHARLAGLRGRQAEVAEEQIAETEERLRAELMLGEGSGVPGRADHTALPTPPDVVPGDSGKSNWLIDLLNKSALFSSLAAIDKLLDQSGALDGRTSLSADQVTPPRFVDERDAQFFNEGQLKPCNVGSVSAAQAIAYQFGVLIVKLLHREADSADVRLLLAETLPTNNYENNAFRNSVLYQQETQTLFIRRERLDNVGDFVLLLVHSLAHIHADNMTDDRDPIFCKYFYRFLRIVCRHVIFSRNLASPLDAAPLRTGLSVDMVGRLMTDRVTDLIDQEPEANRSVRAARYERATAAQTVHRYLTYGSKPSYGGVRDRLAGMLGQGKKVKMAEIHESAGPDPDVVPYDPETSKIAQLSRELDGHQAELNDLTASLTQLMRQEVELSEESGPTATNSGQDISSNQQRKQQIIGRQRLLESQIATKESKIKSLMESR